MIAHMKELILKKSLSNVYCVWLSDGQDNKGLNTLIPIMDDFKVEVENSGASSAVHCIGFSFDHDATLLTKLS